MHVFMQSYGSAGRHIQFRGKYKCNRFISALNSRLRKAYIDEDLASRWPQNKT